MREPRSAERIQQQKLFTHHLNSILMLDNQLLAIHMRGLRYCTWLQNPVCQQEDKKLHTTRKQHIDYITNFCTTLANRDWAPEATSVGLPIVTQEDQSLQQSNPT